MSERNVQLTEHFDKFIDAHIESGRFRDASEIVREGLRLLETREQEEEARIAWLRTTAHEAFGSLDRGDGMRFGSAAELEAYILGVSDDVLSEEALSRR